MAEQPLTGGRLTPGVVRVGDTVRRPAGPHSVVCHHDPGPNNAVFRDSSARRLSVPAPYVKIPPSRAGTVPGEQPRPGDEPPPRRPPHPGDEPHLGGLPVAFIDFDFAAPGDPLEDVGYLAWTWCVSSKPTAPEPAAQARQLSVAAGGYGLDDGQRGGLVDAMLERLERNARWWAGRPEEAASARTAWSWREHAFVRAHRGRFTAALDDGGGRR